MKKILIITGTRADYGRFKTIINSINESKELELKLLATGMHLVPNNGYTINEIINDGYTIDATVDMIINGDSGATMAKSLGMGIIGITQAIESIKPDLIMILGDRGEALAGAIVGAHMNIPVAHIHGGERTGTVDESLRHATTKLSHIHFPATEESKERLIKMGEKPEYIFNVGSPGLDAILNIDYLDKNLVKDKLGFDTNKPVIVMAQHPVTSEIDEIEEQIKETISAIEEMKLQTVIIYPNSDSGGDKIIKEINKLERKNYDFIKTFKNLKYEEYLNLLNSCDVMIGNSSSGIMEAPSFKIPAVNIGTRQNGRERANNIIDCDYVKKDIINGIDKALNDKEFIRQVSMCKNPYGDGNTGVRICEVLEKLELDKKIVQKEITY